MSPEISKEDQHFFIRWVRGTFVGYLLGFVFIILGGIVGHLLDMPESNFIVGIAMGAGVGYGQGRVAKDWLGTIWPWLWATAIGLAVPFVLVDIAAVVWSDFDGLRYLELDVAVAGLCVGLLQRRILRSHSDRANWWVLFSVAGWSLAAWTAAVTPMGGQNALLNLGMILGGGVVLGIVTGGALVWTLRR
jgi:hypothetical protein